MSRRARRNHTKAKVAVAAVKGDRTLARLSEQFDVHPNQITTWKAHLESKAADAFGPGGGASSNRRRVVARQDRRADAGERFLRNGTSFRLQGQQNKAECFGPAMQILDHSRAVVSRSTTSRGRRIPSRDARRCRTGRRSCAPWQLLPWPCRCVPKAACRMRPVPCRSLQRLRQQAAGAPRLDSQSGEFATNAPFRRRSCCSAPGIARR